MPPQATRAPPRRARPSGRSSRRALPSSRLRMRSGSAATGSPPRRSRPSARRFPMGSSNVGTWWPI
eukprot:4443342-Prymnesium_polylepis.1